MKNLRKALEEYLAVRRALGFKLTDAGYVLSDFLSFLERQGASHITTELALRWARQPVTVVPAYWAQRLGLVRRFAQYQAATDPRTEIPPQGLLPDRYIRKPPYLYSHREIVRLIEAAKRLPSATGLRPWTYSVLLGLLAVTGMRISEPIALDREDVDLTRGVLTVRQTKFGKSRLLPIHPSTQRALLSYARRRDRIHPRPKTPSFFVSDGGTRLTHWTVRWTFVRLSHQIGLRGPSDRFGPRLHDLRHRFAVQTLLGWYRAGADVERHLPELATYLGHGHVTDTYWYLSAAPELLRLAAMRLGPTQGGLPS
jgi:integrase/recombinase XerD